MRLGQSALDAGDPGQPTGTHRSEPVLGSRHGEPLPGEVVCRPADNDGDRSQEKQTVAECLQSHAQPGFT